MLYLKARFSSPRTSFVFLTAFTLAAFAGCSDDTKLPAGSDCSKITQCASGLLCYDGTCTAAQNQNLACQVDIDQDTDQDGNVDVQGCNPLGTSPNSELNYICVSGRCQFAPRDNPVLLQPDASVMTDTGTSAAPDAGSTEMDAGMMGPTDAAFVAPNAVDFPQTQSMDEDTEMATTLSGKVNDTQQATGSASSGAMFKFAVDIAEECGMESAKMVLGPDNSNGSNAPDRIVVELTDGNGIANAAGNSTLEFSAVVNPCYDNVQYKLQELHLRDFAGNTRYFQPTVGQEAILSQADKKGDPLTNAGAITPTIQFSGATYSPAPELSNIVASVNGTGGIDVTAAINNQNPECYFQELHVTATSSRGQTLTGMTQVNAAPANGELTASINVPACARSGGWTITSVKLVDSGRREVSYSAAAGQNYVRFDGAATTVAAPSQTLAGGSDTNSPDFSDIQFQASMQAQGTLVDFNLAVDDDACQLGETQVQLTHETGSPSFSMTLNQGTPSLSTGAVPLPMCAKAGNYNLSVAGATDQGGASTVLSASGNRYSVAKTDSSTVGWTPPSVITVRHN